MMTDMRDIQQDAAKALRENIGKLPANTELRLTAVLHNWCANSHCYDFCGACLNEGARKVNDIT